MAGEIHLIAADHHPIMRKGLREVLEEDPDLKVQVEAGDGEAALSLIQELQPHITVLDLDMPKLDGFAVAAETRKRSLRVELIFLIMHSEVDLLHRAVELGAKGYVVKESTLIDIVHSIRSVAAGRPSPI